MDDLNVIARLVNQTETDYPRDSSLTDLFSAQVARTPNAIAIICGDERMTFATLDRLSTKLARELRRQGLESLVGVFINRSPDLVVALLGVLKSGCAYVPLDPIYPAERLAHIIKSANISAVVTSRLLHDNPAISAVTSIIIDDIPQQPEIALPNISPEALAYVIYTSGSTGAPKGVQIQHRALVNLLWAMRATPGLTEADTLAAVTTISFDIAALEIFLPLIVGAKILMLTENQARDGHELLAQLQKHAVTVLQATPITWQILLAAGWTGDPVLKMLVGGEALPRPLANQLLAFGELWNMYGPTETTIWSSVLRVEPGDAPVLLGPPIANTQFYVLDDNLRPVPHGENGELFIGGDSVALGYHDLPEMTNERFLPDTFRNVPDAKIYRTGDIVSWTPDWKLRYAGRADTQVKIRGFRIELGEIEATLLRHPQVSDAAVVVKTNHSGDQSIHAYVVTQATDLTEWVGQFLPYYMVPVSINLLAELPRTPNGKIDRKALPDPVIVMKTASELVTTTEQRIAAIWRSILKIEVIDRSDNFFELGGHSLLATQMLVAIEAEFKRKINFATLLETRDLAALAEYVENANLRNFDFSKIVWLQSMGSKSPLIAINSTGIFVPLAKQLGSGQPFVALQIFDPDSPREQLMSFEEIAAEYVKLILTVQEKGPYTLLGWCNAGILTFEIGRQLHALTGEKPVVIVVDVWAPGHLQRLNRMAAVIDFGLRLAKMTATKARQQITVLKQTRGRFDRLFADISDIWSHRATLDEFFIRHRNVYRVARLFRRGPDLKYFVAEAYDSWVTKYLDASVKKYQMKSYPAHVILMRSEQEPQSLFLDKTMGWAGCARDVDVHVIEGDHFSMFHDDGAIQMAEHISKVIK